MVTARVGLLNKVHFIKLLLLLLLLLLFLMHNTFIFAGICFNDLYNHPHDYFVCMKYL